MLLGGSLLTVGGLDDHSRAVMAARFGFAEDTVRLAAALRPALATRGVPQAVYVDNGSAFVDSWLLRGCATLGIKLIHSTPGRPQGRGKIERFFRTVREQFLVELSTPDTDGAAVADLATLNRLFVAWVETVYHPRIHSSTGAAPLARWRDGLTHPVALPTPARLREAFLWSAQRTVTKTATVSLHGNVYQVDPVLVGRAGRAGLRPVRPRRRRGPLPRPVLRHRHRVPHRAPFPPQSPPRTPRPAAGRVRDRLPAPGRHRPRRPAG